MNTETSDAATATAATSPTPATTTTTTTTTPPPSSPGFLGIEASSVLVLVVVLLCSLYALRRVRAGRLYPPGPRGFPLLGYLYVLWSPDKRKLFAELSAQHGDIFSFQLGCRLVVVVNRFEALRQVFLQQGASFLDRPQVFTFTHVGQGKGEFFFLWIPLVLNAQSIATDHIRAVLL